MRLVKMCAYAMIELIKYDGRAPRSGERTTLKMRKLPNIVYILADDMGYGDVSCLNPDSKLNTVNIDAMARGGMRCTDMHSTSAVCTPSRYGILTGRYNWRSRLKSGVIGGYTEPLIESDRRTVADLMRGAGYVTGCVGKWHLGLSWAKKPGASEPADFAAMDGVDYSRPVYGGPLDHGFDRYFGISASLDMPPYVYIDGRTATALPDHETASEGQRFWRKGPTAPDFDHEQVLPKLTERALEWIDEWADRPFFIYFPLPAPHTPILPTPEFQGKSGTNSYGDFVLMVDDVVGQVCAKLREKGIYDDTLVIFTSDNGCSPMADYPALLAAGHNPSYVFRGHKADIYEGGHRIPFVASWPNGIPAGSERAQTLCLSDLMATAAELIGEKLPDDMGEDSVSELAVWQGGSDAPVRDYTVHHSIDGSFSIRRGKWKLELCKGSGGWSDPKPGEEPADAPDMQLYDLSADISERRNLISEHPDIVKELTDKLIEYIKNGRSTPGAPQPNADQEFFDTYAWYRP